MVKCPKCGSANWFIIEQAKIYSKKSLIVIGVGVLLLYVLSRQLNANLLDALAPAAFIYLLVYFMNRFVTIRKCKDCGRVWRRRR